MGEKGREEGIKGCRNRIIHSPHVREDRWLCLVSARMHSSLLKRIWKGSVYGVHFYISLTDHAKFESQLGSSKFNNINAFSFEVNLEWIVVPLLCNGKEKLHCKATGQVAYSGVIAKSRQHASLDQICCFPLHCGNFTI